MIRATKKERHLKNLRQRAEDAGARNSIKFRGHFLWRKKWKPEGESQVRIPPCPINLRQKVSSHTVQTRNIEYICSRTAQVHQGWNLWWWSSSSSFFSAISGRLPDIRIADQLWTGVKTGNKRRDSQLCVNLLRSSSFLAAHFGHIKDGQYESDLRPRAKTSPSPEDHRILEFGISRELKWKPAHTNEVAAAGTSVVILWTTPNPIFVMK